MQSTKPDVEVGLLKVRLADDGDRVRLALSGELDLATAKVAERALDEALGSGRQVVVDLRELEFLDSTGIALFVLAMREQPGRLSFLPSESLEVTRVLRITGVDQRMGIASEPEPFTFFSAA